MKKILAWLTVLTVNVSMMPMPTVAAATATDASTALNEETITSDATKEATQAQETAKKAVESATKAAATTAAKKVTTETKKAGSKSKSAASTQSLQDTNLYIGNLRNPSCNQEELICQHCAVGLKGLLHGHHKRGIC